MLNYIKLLRLKHWIKNIFVFVPLLFSEKFTDTSLIYLAIICFIGFSLISSAIYIVNDIFDRESDSKHPKKKLRPIASGAVSVMQAIILCVIIIGLAISVILQIPQVAYVVLAYVIINIAYNLGLKNVPVVDLFVITSGFLLRTVAGGFTINVPNSNWMLITIFCLTLFLITIKRRAELTLIGANLRKSIESYSIEFLDKVISITASSTFVFYTMYVAINKQELSSTIPLVLFCIIRYMYLIQANKGENPTTDLFKDKFILLGGLLWVIIVLIALGQNIP